MSHSIVYIFKSEDAELSDILERYWEEKEVDTYIQYTREQAIAKVRQDCEDYKQSYWYTEYHKDPEKYKANCHNEKHIEYLEHGFEERCNWTDEQCYQNMRAMFDDDMVDEDGNLLSDYNPDSKWDWYEVGGRWNNVLVTKEGNGTNEDCVSEIDWDKTMTPFAYIDIDEEWHEKGEMCWWGIVANEMEQDKWETEFKDYANKIHNRKDIVVVAVDVHI